ncbi:MAG: hypothetical protein PHN44_07325, partial [Candidatus Marinimicrobia bacterium]|nr:hypothetical protein [Candidatus Neomarinimicrobiota bacterium]
KMNWESMREKIMILANYNVRRADVHLHWTAKKMAGSYDPDAGIVHIYTPDPEDVLDLWDENPVVYWSQITSRRLNDILRLRDDGNKITHFFIAPAIRRKIAAGIVNNILSQE